MKKFFIFIGKIAVIMFLSAVLLDIFYTFIYLKSSQRNKIVNVINSESRNYDIIFMGSSRTQNHIVTKLFIDKGFKTFNYGMNGSRLNETALLLELMLERHYKIKNLVLDVDLNINSNSDAEGIKAMFMPYLHTSKTIREHYKNMESYNLLLYTPFYRYINYEAKIGFREMFFSAIQKKSFALNNYGFVELTNQGTDMNMNLKDYSPKQNFAYEKIKLLCQKNKINFIPITMPICTNTINRNYFNEIDTVYPEVHHYENAVIDDRYFSSCGHMNTEGATILTTTILDDFIQHKFQN